MKALLNKQRLPCNYLNCFGFAIFGCASCETSVSSSSSSSSVSSDSLLSYNKNIGNVAQHKRQRQLTFESACSSSTGRLSFLISDSAESIELSDIELRLFCWRFVGGALFSRFSNLSKFDVE